MTNTIRPVVVASLRVNGEAQDALRHGEVKRGQPEG